MADVNHVVLIGRLTRDSELKYNSGGMAFGKFSIAVNKRRKQGEQWVEEANFFDINLFGKTAEALNQFLVKGKLVAVEGELHQNRWEKDGQSHSKVEINANNVQLLGGGQGAQQGAPAGQSAAMSAGTQYQKRASTSAGGDDDIPPDFPDNIPF